MEQLTSANLTALCLFFIVPNLIMYMHPKTKLMKAEANDKKAAVLIIGVLAESSWKMVRTALNE